MGVERELASFDAHLVGSGYSGHTVGACGCDLAGLAAFCSVRGLLLCDVTFQELGEFLGSGFARTGPNGHRRSEGAVSSVRGALRSFFGWLHATGQIWANPAVALKSSAMALAPDALAATAESAAGNDGWR